MPNYRQGELILAAVGEPTEVKPSSKFHDSLYRKLHLKEGYAVFVKSPPRGYVSFLTKMVIKKKKLDQEVHSIHIFIKSLDSLEKILAEISDIKPESILWVAYPVKDEKLQEAIASLMEKQVSMKDAERIHINNNWSASLFLPTEKTEQHKNTFKMISQLKVSKIAFKLSVGMNFFIHSQDKQIDQIFKYYSAFSFGKHVLEYEELKLQREQEELGGAALEHAATFLMALQMDEALNQIFGKEYEKNPKTELDEARLIIKLIRNSFAHNPFAPTWNIRNPNNYPKKKLSVAGVLSIDISNINNMPAQWQDYGGKLAVLRLVDYIIDELFETTHK